MKYTDVAALFQLLQARLVPGGANIHPPVIYCTLNISVCKKAGCETQHFLFIFFVCDVLRHVSVMEGGRMREDDALSVERS